MWDNRAKKQSGQFKPNAPDHTCKKCKHSVWLPKEEPQAPQEPTKPQPKSSNRSYALSYAKDLAVAGQIPVNEILDKAEQFDKYLNGMDLQELFVENFEGEAI